MSDEINVAGTIIERTGKKKITATSPNGESETFGNMAKAIRWAASADRQSGSNPQAKKPDTNGDYSRVTEPTTRTED